MLDLNFDPFPYLETKRLTLRRITPDDTVDIFALRTNVEAMKHLGKPIPVDISEIEELINRIEDGVQANTAIGWGLCLKGQSTIIGTVSYHHILKEHFRAEIGYMLLPEYWFKGLMSEVMPVVLDFGFNHMKLHSIEALVDPTNANSIRLLKKFNFLREACFKENFYFNGEFLDTEVYSLLKQ